jgi:pimeloyl-ACP methyl ester carboxylesterase
MKLNIQPVVALCDQKVDLCISELPAYAQVKISASLCLPWAKSVVFESTAWFTADADGRVDLSRQRPDSGSYNFVDSMGLILSVKSKDPKAMEKVTQNISVSESMFIDIVAECGQERASAKLERLFKTPEIKSQRISDEFVGEFFYSDNPNNKTVVWLGGSGSGLAVNAPIAAALASHGFNVLAVAYFGEKGLPPQLSRIPLEYFEKVLAWLANNPITAGKEIQVLGMSKGAEVALLLASRYPIITRMALFAPHAYCFQGIAFKNESSWTYAGKDLPYIRLRSRWVYANMLSGFIKNDPFEFASVYSKGLAVAKNKEEARIKVENAHADLLLITTKECGMWNTYDGCIQIVDTLRKHNYPHAYDLVVYENAGEPYYVPYVFPAGESSMQMARRLVLSMGGTLEGNAHAQADAWEKAIEFLGQTRGN